MAEDLALALYLSSSTNCAVSFSLSLVSLFISSFYCTIIVIYFTLLPSPENFPNMDVGLIKTSSFLMLCIR